MPDLYLYDRRHAERPGAAGWIVAAESQAHAAFFQAVEAPVAIELILADELLAVLIVRSPQRRALCDDVELSKSIEVLVGDDLDMADRKT